VTPTALSLYVELLPYLTPPRFYVKSLIDHKNSIKHFLLRFDIHCDSVCDAEPCPSRVFQDHVKEVLMSDESQCTAFLNSLLNQLNWAFSEFIGMLQEVAFSYTVM
jgi:hypothetical protein